MTLNVCTFDDHLLSRRALMQGAIAGGIACGGFQRLFAEEHTYAARKSEKRVILVCEIRRGRCFPQRPRPSADRRRTLAVSAVSRRFQIAGGAAVSGVRV
jgi:hypothetical protein